MKGYQREVIVFRYKTASSEFLEMSAIGSLRKYLASSKQQKNSFALTTLEVTMGTSNITQYNANVLNIETLSDTEIDLILDLTQWE